MRTLVIAAAAVAPLAFALPALAQEHRELGPHVHGTGTLAIAIAGRQVSIDFSAPANDIIGFEHQPSTPEQTKTLEAAKASLGEPLALFTFPAAAGCTTKSAHVTFNAADPGTAAAPAAGEAGHQHADFDVDYTLDCAAPDKIVSLMFPYFQRFAGAQKLAVTVVSDASQTEFDVTRAAPAHDLK